MSKTEFTFQEAGNIEEHSMSQFQRDDEVVYFQDRRWHVGALANVPEISPDGKRVILHLQQPEPDQGGAQTFDVELASLPKRAAFRLLEQVVCDSGQYDVFEVHAGPRGEILYDLRARDGKNMLRRVPEEKLQIESAVQSSYDTVKESENVFLRRIQDLEDAKYPQLMGSLKKVYERLNRLNAELVQAGYDKRVLDDLRQSADQVGEELRDELDILKAEAVIAGHMGKEYLAKIELDPKKVAEAFESQKRELEAMVESLTERARLVNDDRAEKNVGDVQNKLSSLTPDRSGSLTALAELRTQLRSVDVILLRSEHQFDLRQKPKQEKQIEVIDIPASDFIVLLEKRPYEARMVWKAAYGAHEAPTIQALKYLFDFFKADPETKHYVEQLQQPQILSKVARGLIALVREDQKNNGNDAAYSANKDVVLAGHLFATVVRRETMPYNQRVVRIQGEHIELTAEDVLLYHEMLEQAEHAEGIIPTEQARLRFARLLYDLRHNEKVQAQETYHGDSTYFPPGIFGKIKKMSSDRREKEMRRGDEQASAQIKETVALITDSLKTWKTEGGDITAAELFEYRALLLAMLSKKPIDQMELDHLEPHVARYYLTHTADVSGMLQRNSILRDVVTSAIREIDRSGIVVGSEGFQRGAMKLRDAGYHTEEEVTNSSSVQFKKLVKRWERPLVYSTVALAVSAMLAITASKKHNDVESQQETSLAVKNTTSAEKLVSVAPKEIVPPKVVPTVVEQPQKESAPEPKATVEWFVSKAASPELGLLDVMYKNGVTLEQLQAWTRQWATANPDKLQDYYAIRDFKDWVRRVKVFYPDALAPGEEPRVKSAEVSEDDEVVPIDEPSEEVGVKEVVEPVVVTGTAPLAIQKGEGDPVVYLYNAAKPTEPFSFSLDKDYKPELSEDKHYLLLQKEGEVIPCTVHMARVDDEVVPVFTIKFDDGDGDYFIRGGQLVLKLDNSLVFAD